MNTILLTGCAGFIGANFLKTIATANKKYNFIILDALTYAGHYPTIEKDILEMGRMTGGWIKKPNASQNEAVG